MHAGKGGVGHTENLVQFLMQREVLKRHKDHVDFYAVQVMHLETRLLATPRTCFLEPSMRTCCSSHH